MPLISLCMIVRNEEAVLGRCLNSVADLVDEIIVVDTGSTDATKIVASQFEAKIYDFPWQNDFSAARNFAVSQAVGDYWMWLDADDVIEPSEHGKLQKILQNPDADVVFLPYLLAFDEKGNPTMTSQRERIFKRNQNFQFEGSVHEAVTARGKIRYGDAAVSHRKLSSGNPNRNLDIYQQKILRGETFSPREQYYYGRELVDHGAFHAALSVLQQFLTEEKGWAPDKIDACLLCCNCCRKLTRSEEALRYLLQSFQYGEPRPEICCEIGSLFMEQNRFETAIFWYKIALQVGTKSFPGFRIQAYGDFIPAIQLCVCYDRMGDIPTAAAYNELAGRIQPQSTAVCQNRQYFASKGIVV